MSAVFDRAEILGSAHAATRLRMSPHHSQRRGDTWNAEVGGWVPKAGYRVALAEAMRSAWAMAKAVAHHASMEGAVIAIPADIADRVAAMRADACFEPITSTGNDRMSRILAEAHDIEMAARLSIIPAMDHHHVA